MPFYAVAKGRASGMYQTWAECEQQVKGFKGAIFKKFKSRSEAQNFLARSQESGGTGFAQQVGRKAVDAVKIKQELPESTDYIPLECKATAGTGIKQEIKTEKSEDDLWFEDSDGDKELLAALSVLQEYPDTSTTTRTANRKAANTQTKRLQIGRYNFTADAEDYVDAYIGGYAENVGSWNCMAGYGVYFGPNHPLNIAKSAVGRITHNVGDIGAAIDAIKLAEKRGIPKLCLHTNSEFLLSAVASWFYNWKRNGWRNSAGKVVQNRKELEKLSGLLDDSNVAVKWHNVKGCRNALKPMREVEMLAKIGTEEYLEKHPSKDDTLPPDGSDFDFFF